MPRRLHESTKMEPKGCPADQLFDHRIAPGDRLAANPPQELPKGGLDLPQTPNGLKNHRKCHQNVTKI